VVRGLASEALRGRRAAPDAYSEFGRLAKHVRYVERTSRKLARAMFYAMGRYQAKLERKGALLGRFVDIGAELFAMTAACVRAQSMKDQPNGREAALLADVFCRRSRLRVKELFGRLTENADDATYQLAQGVLKGQFGWLEEGAIQAVRGPTVPPEAASAPARDRNLSDTRVATQIGGGA
jgi:hypothetical protein